MKTLLTELRNLPPNTALRLTEQARMTLVHALELVEPVDAMLAELGYLGSMDATDGRVADVLAALNKVDPK